MCTSVSTVVRRTLACALAFVASGALAADGYLLQRGTLVDATDAVLYSMEPEGAIVARHVTSGNVIWASPIQGEPLGLVGDRLVALAEPTDPRRAEVIFLNAESGTAESTIGFELPVGATVSIDDLPHRRFRAAIAAAAPATDVYLHWSFSASPLRGALLEEEASAQPRKSSSVQLQGVLRLDPMTGSAVVVESRHAQQLPAAFVPDLRDNERIPQLAGRQFRSVDDRFVLASRRVGDVRTWERYRWTVADRETGQRIGAVLRPTSMASFFVADSTMLQVSQPQLRRLPSGELEAKGLRLEAFDLRSGSRQWTADLRDTAFRGAMPP